MLNKFYKLFLTSTLGVLVLLYTGCGGSSSSEDSSSVSSSKEPIYSYVYFPNSTNENIIITSLDGINIAFKSEVSKDGTFVVDIDNSFDDNELMMIKLENSSLITYATVKDLKEKGIFLSALSTLANLKIKSNDTSSEIIEKLSLFAKKVIRNSTNDNKTIDYKDINSYKIKQDSYSFLLNPEIFTQFEQSGFLNAIENNDDLIAFINEDKDNDSLNWEEEVLYGTNLEKTDSDDDGISDSKEIELGLDPINNDTDFDGILDNDELLGTTDPRLSDTDGDYFSDSYEVNLGSDPLEKDENANGILDGLEGDPLFKYQWHLKSNADIVSNTNNKATIIGNDLNILDVYKYQRGDTDTIIQIVDTGVELLHEDLNVNTSYSRNSINATNDPSPTREVSSYNKLSPFEIGHGTGVAGIAAAIANNGLGLRGVAPNAIIAGSNWLEEQSIEELDSLWYNSPYANKILVSNNSWGTYMSKDKNFEDILKLASQELRDGKGRIFTFASGNERENYGNANLSYITNNRYAITVASLNHENKYSYFSNPGSNVLVSAYGGSSYEIGPSIATTLLTGESYYESELGSTLGAITFDDDINRSYTFAMNGTSASTPMVSGALALVLTSCPQLTWRDVKWLLSYKSKKIDPENEFWVKNSANRNHNINYGYGLIDTNSIIQECRSKYYKLLPDEIFYEIKKDNINLHIPDYDKPKSIYIDFLEDFNLEWVELTVDSNHSYAGDYEINLISPHGTKTQIIAPNELRSDYYKGGFRFSSAAFTGEKTKGIWQVEFIDKLELDSGDITSVGLKIYGHKD